MRRPTAFGLSIFLALPAACVSHRLAENPRPRPAAPAPAPAQSAATPAAPLAAGAAESLGTAVSFETHVRPVLERSCTPCHFTGGKMYDRLPFDDPKTALSKKEGILRRLKATEDRRTFEEWVAVEEGSR